MSEYTPTTDDVREDFAFPWSPEQIGDKQARLEAFDRWLAEHDAALVEKLANGINGRSGGQQEAWLRARAAEIREGTK